MVKGSRLDSEWLLLWPIADREVRESVPVEPRMAPDRAP